MTCIPSAVQWNLCTGELQIDSQDGGIGFITLQCPAWTTKDLIELWLSGDVRGENDEIPGAIGLLPNPQRIDQTLYTLQMFFVGVVDRFGTPYADPMIGLETNLAFFSTNIVDPPAAPVATRAAILTLPSGASRTADIQVQRLQVGQHMGDYLAAALRIRIPAGRFV